MHNQTFLKRLRSIRSSLDKKPKPKDEEEVRRQMKIHEELRALEREIQKNQAAN